MRSGPKLAGRDGSRTLSRDIVVGQPLSGSPVRLSVLGGKNAWTISS